MTIELVDGKAGVAHISSEDKAIIHQAKFSKSDVVFDWGDSFKCTMSSSNRATIGTGCASIQGLDWHITSAESVTISNGSQGMKRNDIICAHYNRNPKNGNELVELVVLKGSPNATAAADPTIPSGKILSGAVDAYMPLWRIPLDGITVGTPVRLFTPRGALWDSVTQSDWQPLEMMSGFSATKGWGVRGLMIKRAGSLVILYGMIRRTGGWENNYQVARIPEDMRPSYRVCAPTLYLNEGLASIGEQSDNPDTSTLRLGYTHYGDGAQATLINMIWML
ncbi:hypothetical protein [Bifidobacterium pseudocatenulatum]|uniref:hypothetical protein n=5 Tax=Bifidobacterium pseudocatenulatum TaxID=28026 RepID=UPI0022E57AB8|nr:hypothetical protein [Bifidobacterium pseudocatenulatum]